MLPRIDGFSFAMWRPPHLRTDPELRCLNRLPSQRFGCRGFIDGHFHFEMNALVLPEVVNDYGRPAVKKTVGALPLHRVYPPAALRRVPVFGPFHRNARRSLRF